MSDDAPSAPPRRTPPAALAAIVVGIVVAVRVAGLDALPGEWFGDISTLYETTRAASHGDFPPTLYVLGVGPLYPLLAAAVLAGGSGASYLAFKLIGVSLSFVALAALHALARRLHPDAAFALVAVLVAGTGSWLLALSRLGDQHPLPVLLSVAAVGLAVTMLRREPRAHARAAACGVLSGAGLYAYGAAFALPAVTGAIVLAGWRRRRVPRAVALTFVFALAVVVAPLAWSVLSHWAEVRGGHFGNAAASLREIPGNVVRAFGAYFVRGDDNFRVNPAGLPHLDGLSAVAMVAGAGWWLMPSRRESGAIVVGAFVAMHVPSILAAASSLPSAGRTIAAAPFAYLLVAGGLWGGFEALARLRSRRVAALALTAGLATMAAINLHRYFGDYRVGLPWGNTEVARPIVGHIAAQPAGTHAYLVDTGWGPHGTPEFKSVRYGAPAGTPVDELASVELDCDRLASLVRPGLLIWRPSLPLPSDRLCDCAGGWRPDAHASAGGVPLFRSAPVPDRDAAPIACDAEVRAAFAGPSAPPGPASTPAVVASPPGEATVSTPAGRALLRHPPLDMGAPADAFDGIETTLMRGARDNPFHLVLVYAQPVRVATIELVLGFMPHYEVAVTVVDEAGRRHAASGSFEGVPDAVQRPRVGLAEPVDGAREIRVTIADRRPAPPEGFHVHVYEARLR